MELKDIKLVSRFIVLIELDEAVLIAGVVSIAVVSCRVCR
jgi:hypothetical protein